VDHGEDDVAFNTPSFMRSMRATRPETPITFYTTEKPVQDTTSYSDTARELFRDKSNVWVQRAPRPMNALRLWEPSDSGQKDSEGELGVKGPETPQVAISAVSKTAVENDEDLTTMAQWQRFDMLFPPRAAGSKSRAGSESLKDDARKSEPPQTRDYRSD
jgi:hypothetical protein